MSEREALDLLLSAWLDGELPPEEAEALARRVEREPELAARAAALRRVDEALRTLPVSAARTASLRERLDERLAAGEGEARPAPVVPLRRPPLRRVLPAAAAAAALAAGVALYLVLRGAPSRGPGTAPAPVPELAREPVPAPPTGEPSPERETPAPPPETLAREPEPLPAPPDAGEPEPPDERELAIALDYELLRDFEVIDQLELLEVLAAQEALERGGPS